MAIKWNELKHKSSPGVRARLKKEAHEELERIGLNRLRRAVSKLRLWWLRS